MGLRLMNYELDNCLVYKVSFKPVWSLWRVCLKTEKVLDLVLYTFNPSIQEAETESLPGLHSKFQDSQGYIERPYNKKLGEGRREGGRGTDDSGTERGTHNLSRR